MTLVFLTKYCIFINKGLIFLEMSTSNPLESHPDPDVWNTERQFGKAMVSKKVEDVQLNIPWSSGKHLPSPIRISFRLNQIKCRLKIMRFRFRSFRIFGI